MTKVLKLIGITFILLFSFLCISNATNINMTLNHSNSSTSNNVQNNNTNSFSNTNTSNVSISQNTVAVTPNYTVRSVSDSSNSELGISNILNIILIVLGILLILLGIAIIIRLK